MIKTIGLLTRKDGWTHEQFMKHWVEIHAPLALAVPGLRRYVQNHIQGERTRADIPATDVEIDGIAELWFDDQAALESRRAHARDEGAARRRREVHRPHQELRRRGEIRHRELRPRVSTMSSCSAVEAGRMIARPEIGEEARHALREAGR